MNFPVPIVILVFSRQLSVSELTEVEWDLLIRQTRKAMLLAKLYYLVLQQISKDKIPNSVWRHLKSAHVHSEKQFNDLLWEIRHLKVVAKNLGSPMILLKGAAYAIAGLSAAKGRVFSDIDILVPFNDIAQTESELMLNGWMSSNLDAYDQRYYRKWMHEIPAMRHIIRGSVIDLHHNILPRTVKSCPDARLLINKSLRLEQYDGISILAPVDRIIHSATHLFYDGELEHGCRDIVDLYELLNEFIQHGETLGSLIERANELGLQKPVYYALRYVKLILKFSVSAEMVNSLNKNTPSGLMIPIMDFLFIRALMPDHVSCNDRWTGLARWLLYIRSHWLRMPLYQLIPHLLRKSYKQLLGKDQH